MYDFIYVVGKLRSESALRGEMTYEYTTLFMKRTVTIGCHSVHLKLDGEKN